MRCCDLQGQGVLVTRPAHQAERLCQLIEAAGGRPLRFPALVIEPTHDPAARALLAEHWDLVYCVSPNAVSFAHAIVADRHPWLRAERVAVVGAGTARELEALGRPADLVPSGRFESEEVLALPELSHLDGQRVLIMRGEGGRGLMAETLRERGARVSIAEVYRRTCPKVDPQPLLARWSTDVDWVTVTSEQILRNLLAILGPTGREQLLATPLVVIAARTAEAARTLGFRDVVLAERASDEAVLAALCCRPLPA
ncbi:uroporphyrinogen-III synthase [Thiorhodovibrio frisius]|uniref:Uroporphyrinogen-III synthase n=1 Tax=Thiorhodovibrio frisius TaxID=631362 RepID=H8YVE9_9GAMM|nr:uroporphyrinogen-III synthase [Thiorhodovibrio frisius]EIC23889.1 uroporphyrinogen-III synthase [Thiorhodovibrio frisius]WPL23133.1 Uroporphyrinogen-III synthase [Thiorhodovibrio frisius]